MANQKALIHYYARLIRKDQWEMKDVPEDIQDDVRAKIKELEEAEKVEKESKDE